MILERSIRQKPDHIDGHGTSIEYDGRSMKSVSLTCNSSVFRNFSYNYYCRTCTVRPMFFLAVTHLRFKRTIQAGVGLCTSRSRTRRNAFSLFSRVTVRVVKLCVPSHEALRSEKKYFSRVRVCLLCTVYTL
jgi:hypothetical protein